MLSNQAKKRTLFPVDKMLAIIHLIVKCEALFSSLPRPLSLFIAALAAYYMLMK